MTKSSKKFNNNLNYCKTQIVWELLLDYISSSLNSFICETSTQVIGEVSN